MDTNLIEAVKQRAAGEHDLSWMEANQPRSERWEHLFDPKLHEDPVDQELVDIMKDPVLDHYMVDKSERRRRQWIPEHVLDNMERKAHEPPGPLNESTASTDIAAFTTWALPMTRHYLPKQFLWQIVPTYPMSQATGKHYTLDTQYGDTGSYASGTSIYGNPDPTYSEDPGECTEANDLDMVVTDDDISAISRKLQGVWSIEAAQDFQSYHRLIMENEVVKMLGAQIERETNRYGINQLVSNATTTTNWNSSQPMATTNGWSNATPRQYNESLFDAIEDANRAIKDETFRNANFILCGTTFASRLRKLNGFRLLHDSGDGLTANIVTGPNLEGQLGARYVVYEDVDFPADKALVGHKSNTWMYTGAVYCPYVTAWRTPVVHTLTMCPGVGYLTRFAFHVVNGDFYGMVVVY